MIQLWPLYKLQQVDTKIALVANKGDGTAGDEIQKKIRIRERKLKEAQAVHQTKKTALKDAELKLASIESKIKEIDKKMNSGKVTNFKELEDLGKEKEMFASQKGGFEDQTLALMDEVEAANVEVQQITARLDKAKKQWDEHLSNSDVSKKANESELSELMAKREEMAKEIDPQLMSRYEGIRKRKEGVAIAKMEGNACGACGAGLPESVRRRVKERQLELCDMCERILFAD